MSAISDQFLAWCKEHGITHPPAIAADAFEFGYLTGSSETHTKVLQILEMPPTAPTAERQEVTYQDNSSAKEGECQ